jgi:phasin family protein
MNLLTLGVLPFAFTDLTKVWTSCGFPFRNIEAVREAQHKNAATLTSINQAILEGLTTAAHLQAKFLQSTIDDYRKVTTDVLASNSLQEGAAKQIDGNGRVYLSSFGHVRELSDVAVGANVSAVDILNNRVGEVFDELKAAVAVPVGASRADQTDAIGEHIASSEGAGSGGDVEAKPAPVVKARRRQKAKPAGKVAHRRTSRR